jgi:hypothetical protein
MRFELLFLLAALSSGCGAPPPAPRPPPPAAAPTPVPARAPVGDVEAEIGGLNEEAMDRAFSALPVADCLVRASQKLGVLGGEIKVKLRINREGGVRWAYLAESTLGDRETERCVLELTRSKTWPKPVGGEGIAEKSYAMDARTPPADLDLRTVHADLIRARSETARCRRGIRGSFSATLYVRPSGQVVAAGVAPPSEKGEQAVDCIVEALLKARFRKTARRTAKVSFAIP